eukprot:TRINITY_DN26410_c0_g1_i2.p1 TRINITY_DN26410_c0_g1~~TRINITY_DN26410_c0_g1_i2.p1  ORF type:complete len:292 (+),score=29.92 TRINITY_DN26410_c0_g1_i2:153-1028(+)
MCIRDRLKLPLYTGCHRRVMRCQSTIAGYSRWPHWLQRCCASVLSHLLTSPLTTASTILATSPSHKWPRVRLMSALLWSNTVGIVLPKIGIVVCGRRIAPVTTQLLSMLVWFGSPSLKCLWDHARRHGVHGFLAPFKAMIPCVTLSHALPACTRWVLGDSHPAQLLALNLIWIASYPLDTVHKALIIQPQQSLFALLWRLPLSQLYRGFHLFLLRQWLIWGLEKLLAGQLGSVDYCSQCGAASLIPLPCGHAVCDVCALPRVQATSSGDLVIQCPVCRELTSSVSLEHLRT